MKKTKDVLDKPTQKKREKILCLIGYIIVPLFFIILYLIMFMSYEDLYQSYVQADRSVPTIIHDVYFYLPRIGEIFQHIAVHFMTLSTSFGADLLFRLFTAFMSILLIYLCTFFVLGKKPGLNYKDFLIYGGCFLLLMISEVSETFTFRFSYANNYVIAGVVSLAFLLPFRLKTKTSKILPIIGIFILGILFGMSTEIGPLAIFIIFTTWFLIKLFKKDLKFKTFFKAYKLQIFGLVGAVIGLLLYYANGSISARAASSYGAVYDYVSIFDLFKGQTLITIYKLWQHAWFNLRYLMFTPLIISLFILTENLISKHIKSYHNNWRFYTCVLTFCILYMGASCQIKVYDDLYPRYFFLVYLAIFSAILLFINTLLRSFTISQKSLKISSSIIVSLSIIALIDMVIAFTIYRIQISSQLYKIQPIIGAGVEITEEYHRTTMIPSPIFKFAQLSPFDWGDTGNAMKYGYGPIVKTGQ